MDGHSLTASPLIILNYLPEQWVFTAEWLSVPLIHGTRVASLSYKRAFLNCAFFFNFKSENVKANHHFCQHLLSQKMVSCLQSIQLAPTLPGLGPEIIYCVCHVSQCSLYNSAMKSENWQAH